MRATTVYEAPHRVLGLGAGPGCVWAGLGAVSDGTDLSPGLPRPVTLPYVRTEVTPVKQLSAEDALAERGFPLSAPIQLADSTAPERA